MNTKTQNTIFYLDNILPVPFKSSHVLDSNVVPVPFFTHFISDKIMQTDSLDQIDMSSVSWSVIYNAETEEFYDDYKMVGECLEIQYSNGLHLKNTGNAQLASIFFRNDKKGWAIGFSWSYNDHYQKAVLVINMTFKEHSLGLYYYLPEGKLFQYFPCIDGESTLHFVQ